LDDLEGKGYCAGCYANCAALWLNGTLKAMVQLDRAMMNFNRLSIIFSSLVAILNATLLSAAITNVRQITMLYPRVDNSIRDSSITTASIGL